MELIAYQEVPELVLRELPEFRPMYDEHVQDHGEVLPHVLFGDLSRFTVAAYKRRDAELVKRIISLMERLLREGDDATIELVGVSFVENISPEDTESDFFALYGPLLRADLETSWSGLLPDDYFAKPS